MTDSASAFRRVSVRVCMWLVMLAPGSSAQAKLPVRSWHHLPPSQAYTEDNRALLWGSCDLSVQLVCPYFCHPVRIWLLSFSLFPWLCLPLVLVIIAVCWHAKTHTRKDTQMLLVLSDTPTWGLVCCGISGSSGPWLSFITLLSLAVNWCLQHVDAWALAHTAP